MSDTNENADLPAAYALHLLDLVARWDVAPEELLKGLDLDRERLGQPAERLSMDVIRTLIRRACARTGEPGLGMFMGLQLPLSAHGYLGFAAMTAPTAGQAIDLAVRFAPTRTTALALRLHEEGDCAALYIDERVDLGEARDFIVGALMVGIFQIGRTATGEELEGSADVTFPEPRDFDRFRNALPGTIRFDQPRNRLLFRRSYLELPFRMADPVALKLALEQCERELKELGRDERLVARVRRLLPDEPGGFRALNEVARKLHVSPRTLKRKLAAHGTSYSALLDEARKDLAEHLLSDPSLSTEQVAERLGYSDVANFNRAFRRLFGTTPGAYRKTRGG